MLQILVVEDDRPISKLICLNLKKTGYACTTAFDGMSAADLLEKNRYDLILLDVMLPLVDGFELMDYIRPLEIPVIFITAKDSVKDRVRGLRLGADDYIVKPFEMIELLARIDTVLRRYHKTDVIVRIGGLEIDTRSRQVWRDGLEIKLTKTEYGLLLLFARNPRRALSRETIYEQVWGGEFPFGSKVVDLQVQRLRKKVGWDSMLKSVNRVGYRLEATV
ncbi:response regulator transcription factor [Roseburia hominis]